MEVEVKEALRALTQESTQMTAHQVLGLQDRLRIVDEKFSQLRTEITRLNSILSEEREKNGLLKERVNSLMREKAEIKSKQTSSSVAKAPKKSSSKKKSTKKKK